jgi:hypothetical protein
MLEFPQPAKTKSRTTKAGTKKTHARRGKLNRINPSYNRMRWSGRAKAECYFWVAAETISSETAQDRALLWPNKASAKQRD